MALPKIVVPQDRPITPDDFPEVIDREDLADFTEPELRRMLETMKRHQEHGMLDDQGRVVLTCWPRDPVYDPDDVIPDGVAGDEEGDGVPWWHPLAPDP